MGRRIYDKEFKLNALELWKNGKKMADVCRDLGIPESTFSGWQYQSVRRSFSEGGCIEG